MNSGTNIWIEVGNKNIDIDNPFRNESAGFNWFFSFLVRLSKIASGKQNIIMLLDEPGLSLHPEAQVDLIKYFESITETHQIIYTTHSPFMIDRAHLGRVRPVENLSISMEPKHEVLPNEEKGTKVSNEISDADKSSLFVLQGVLGYDVLSNNILVVEGRSDKEYIKTLSSFLNQKGRKGISLFWDIIPAGAFGNIKAMLELLRSLTESDPNLAVLVDYEKDRNSSIENLRNKGAHVITCKEFSNNKETDADADIEDIFTPDFYLDLVNSKFGMKIEISELRSKNSRIVKRLKDYFKENPLPNNKGFPYAQIAYYLSEQTKTSKLHIPDPDLERFEELFEVLNNLLPTQ